MLKKLYIALFAALVFATCLTGCGKANEESKELADFSATISDFTKYIQDTDEKLNALDTQKTESVDTMLDILDDMNVEFAELAAQDFPEQYAAAQELARSASDNMSSAVSHYHTAFEGEEFASNEADAAYQYYLRSMEDLEYIGHLLANEEVSGNGDIQIYHESNDSHILNKWLSGDDEDDERETASETDAPEADN